MADNYSEIIKGTWWTDGDKIYKGVDGEAFEVTDEAVKEKLRKLALSRLK